MDFLEVDQEMKEENKIFKVLLVKSKIINFLENKRNFGVGHLKTQIYITYFDTSAIFLNICNYEI